VKSQKCAPAQSSELMSNDVLLASTNVCLQKLSALLSESSFASLLLQHLSITIQLLEDEHDNLNSKVTTLRFPLLIQFQINQLPDSPLKVQLLAEYDYLVGFFVKPTAKSLVYLACALFPDTPTSLWTNNESLLPKTLKSYSTNGGQLECGQLTPARVAGAANEAFQLEASCLTISSKADTRATPFNVFQILSSPEIAQRCSHAFAFVVCHKGEPRSRTSAINSVRCCLHNLARNRQKKLTGEIENITALLSTAEVMILREVAQSLFTTFLLDEATLMETLRCSSLMINDSDCDDEFSEQDFDAFEVDYDDVYEDFGDDSFDAFDDGME